MMIIKDIRHLAMMAVLLSGSIAASAGVDFNPDSPNEPGAPKVLSRLVLLQNIDDAGSVSGAGKYYCDDNVSVYAYVNSAYSFLNWTDTRGNVVSTAKSFTFRKTAAHDTLIANYAFVPSNPNEPAEPSTTLYYRLLLKTTDGLSVSGSGRYLAGKTVSCSASLETGYAFKGWFRNDGTKVSGSKSFSYTVPVGGDTLLAVCEFDPSAPQEPGDPILKHFVNVSCSDGGSWSGPHGRYLEGTSISLSAYNNSGYDFLGWYLNGELYTKLRSFSYTVGKENLNFHALYVFNPDSPSEPLMADLSSYSFYLMTVNGLPGDTVSYPIMLNNSKELGDINIRLTFPANMTPNLDNFKVGASAAGYTVYLAQAVDTISILEEGAQLWDFSLIGGTTLPGTGALLTFDVAIPDTMGTGGRHQVKINQISLVQPDGQTITAHTRNGRIGVFKRGDANGDNTIDVLDVVGALSLIKGSTDEELIREVTDTNNDGTIDVLDAVGVIELIKSQNNE